MNPVSSLFLVLFILLSSFFLCAFLNFRDFGVLVFSGSCPIECALLTLSLAAKYRLIPFSQK